MVNNLPIADILFISMTEILFNILSNELIYLWKVYFVRKKGG